MDVDNGQDPQLFTQGQLVMDIQPDGFRTVVTQLGLHPPFWGLVAQLQSQDLVNIIDHLNADLPALPVQDNVNAAIAIAHTNRRRARTDGATTAHISQISRIRRFSSAGSVRRDLSW